MWYTCSNVVEEMDWEGRKENVIVEVDIGDFKLI